MKYMPSGLLALAILLTVSQTRADTLDAEVAKRCKGDFACELDLIRRAMFEVAIEHATNKPPHRCRLPLLKAPGEEALLVPVIINRVGQLFFALDTGFSGSLVIPQGFLKSLRAGGYFSKLDIAGPPARNTLADGSKVTLQTIVIREVILGGCRAFTNVLAIIAPPGATPLLGRGLLSSFEHLGIEPGVGEQGGSLSLVPYGLPYDEQ